MVAAYPLARPGHVGGQELVAAGQELVVGGQEFVAADPDLADPRIAAARYRALLGELEATRVTLDERVQAGRAEVVAQAQRYRDAATTIRNKVDETWDHIAPSMSQHGLYDLEDLQSSVPAEALASLEDDGRPVARAKRRAARRDDKRLPARAGSLDPAKAPQDAYRLCHEAMMSAAELRGFSHGGRPVPPGAVTAVACILAGVFAVLARMLGDVTAFACLGAGAALGWLAVTSLTEAGRVAAVRAGLVAAGSAGVVVLATARFTPSDPVGLVASVVAVAVAIRFGLGVGAAPVEVPASKSRGSQAGRKQRTW
jgi:hypothetical protein